MVDTVEPVQPARASAERERSLSPWVLASYGAPAAPLALVGLPLAVYLPALYADADGFGLTLGLVTLLIALSRLTDVVTDPVIGLVSDRVRTRWGRRKPFLLVGTPIYAVGIWLLFVPPFEFSDVTLLGWTFSGGYPYLFAMVAFVYLGSTIKDLPYYAWGAELSNNYHERTLITSWREGFTIAGGLIASLTPAVILFFGYTKPADAVYVLAIILCVMMPLFVVNALIMVPEHPVVETREKMPLAEGLRLVVRNGPYMRLIVIFVFSSLGAAMTNSLSFFFVKHVLLAGELYGLYVAPVYLSQIVAIPIWFAVSRRIGKHRATMYAIGWYGLWSLFVPVIAVAPESWFRAFEVPLLLGFLPPEALQSVTNYFAGIPSGKFVFFIIVVMMKGSAVGALAALASSMAADVVDVDTRETGQQRAGAYFSIWSMTRKAAYAIGILVGGGSAVLFGFDSLADPRDSTNTPFALFMLACLYSVVPALFKFIAMPLLWRYPLTETRLNEIQKEIEITRPRRP